MSESSLYEQVMALDLSDGLPLARVRASGGVVPWRQGEDGAVEVYWVERSLQLPFMGGFHAFPGGGLSRDDRSLPVSGEPRGIGEGPVDGAMPAAVLSGVTLDPLVPPGLLGCVVRELFEETGLLLAGGAEESRLAELRRLLLEKETSFCDLVGCEGWSLDASRLVYAGRWLTPAMGPLRFDNRFFLLEWAGSESLQPEVCGGELVAGEWVRPAAALDRWRRGDVMTAPPIIHILQVLADLPSGAGPDAVLGRLRAATEMNLGPHRRIEFRPGVLLFPLPTPTLPPASHTNTYVLGTEETVVVDPGSPFPEQTGGLLESLQMLESQGRTVSAIWLTHHHPDHVGGVEALRRALRVPVCAHPETARRLVGRGIEVDRELVDGQTIVLGGEPSFPVRVIHTPGHARGHLAFLDETFGSLLGGDLTAGIGTIVIDPPEGNLDEYLESLAKVRDLGAKALFPAHGPPTVSVTAKIDEYIEHRLWREQRVLERWQQGLREDELLAAVYDDVAPIALPLAARQLEAHLERLERLGTIAGTK